MPDCDANRASAMHSNEEIVTAMFNWWNKAFEADGLTTDGFAQFFAKEASFVVNGNVRGEGPAGLSTFFGGQRAEIGMAVLHLPFLMLFSSGKYVFVEYDMCIGPCTMPTTLNAKGYACVEDGRIVHYAVNTHAR